jgi:hypothetical protein
MMDILRSFAGPLINTALQGLGKDAAPAQAPAQAAPNRGLQVQDGFDAEPQVARGPQTARAAQVGNTNALDRLAGNDAADPAAGAAEQGQDAMAQNPIMQLVTLFTDFIKSVMSTFFGGGQPGLEAGADGAGQGTGAQSGVDAAGALAGNGRVNVKFSASLEIDGQQVAAVNSDDAAPGAVNASSSPTPSSGADSGAPNVDSSASTAQPSPVESGGGGGGDGSGGDGGGGGDGSGGDGGGGGDDPITIDTTGRGIRTLNRRVGFDIDADGKKDSLAEVSGGMLAIRGGKDGRDLIGNHTDFDGDGKADGFADGFDALEHLAKKEGLVNERRGDTTLDRRDLSVLERKYGLGIKDGYGGAKKSLASAGVRSIELSKAKREETRLDAEGNRLVTRQGATANVNGQTRTYGDVWSMKG